MTPDFHLYITGKSTVFLSAGDEEFLFPIKKGTSEAVYLKGTSVFYGHLYLEITEWAQILLRFKHTEYSLFSPNRSTKEVRTTNDQKVKVSAYPDWMYAIDEKTCINLCLFDVHAYEPSFDFLKTWIYALDERENTYEYQFSEGLSNDKILLIAAKARNENLPDYQTAAIANLAFKLYQEVNDVKL